ncbi:hypothetical protein NQ176_g4770 [Zarea fungicola]|uniref:Uncharacterized protein n=1 Tax=Zarea fungicola TaxID=93591 RepID=A0ACC1NBS9_9HYPO|nr:hypothetical protein NQ176_g4770 [Lecanicillium fungicola]
MSEPVRPKGPRGRSKTVRKSFSAEPVLDHSSSSEDEDRAGGARLTCGSLSPSPVSMKLATTRTTTSLPLMRRPLPLHLLPAVILALLPLVPLLRLAAVPLDAAPLYAKKALEEAEGSPGPVDAQAMYPPTACIFVANLAQAYDDKILEKEVTNTFIHWGDVFVKIRRDVRGMPFAFCQFTTDEHARNAEKLGKGLAILGRPCRTEMARANTYFVVYRNDGQSVTVGEVVDLLSTLGEVAKAEKLDEDVQRSLRLPPSILASYKMYDPKRDVLTSLRGHRRYTVVPHDPKSTNLQKPIVYMSPAKGELGDKFERDRRSIYMGNLPMDMSEETITNLCGAVGEVVSVVLFKRAVTGNPGKMTCFSFVEFATLSSATDAIAAFNNTDIKGFRIKVDKKQSRTVETPRRTVPARSAHYSHATFPRRRPATSHQPVSPLTSLFTRPSVQKKTSVDSSERSSSSTVEKTPKNVTTITKMASSTQKKHATPTPRKVNGGQSSGGYVNVDTPIPPMQAQSQAQQQFPAPLWVHNSFNPYYVPPHSTVPPHYAPMAPHGNAGVVYSTYNTAPPSYPSMMPDMYPVGGHGHMMPPPVMPPPHMGHHQMVPHHQMGMPQHHPHHVQNMYHGQPGHHVHFAPLPPPPMQTYQGQSQQAKPSEQAAQSDGHASSSDESKKSKK